jgi:hypothetical protein
VDMPEQNRTGGNKKVSGNIPQKTPGKQNKDFLFDALHIFVLFASAVAQPVYDLLSRYAEFLVARQSNPIDIIALIIFLSLIMPLAVVAIEAVSGLFSRKVRKGIHSLIFFSLVTVLAMQALKQIYEFPGIYILSGAIVTGIAVTYAYSRFNFARLFLSILSPAILIFPALFLFHSPVYKIVFVKHNPQSIHASFNDQNGSVPATSTTRDFPPIVIVVFEELPSTSLMDRDRQIDPVRYPNFAAIAQDAYWFRNATTVSSTTVDAIPAMLTGIYPDKPRLPNSTDYPDNIFTLLSMAYDLNVYETVTQLCPYNLCERETVSFTERMISLLADLTAVYLHILLPRDFTSALPVVTQSWKDFSTGMANLGKTTTNETGINETETRRHWKIIGDELEKNRAEVFRQFVRSIDNTGRPALHFYHCYLTHMPWFYLPSGKKYILPGYQINGLTNDKWDNNELFSAQAFQHHLLQLGFADKLLGELIDRLKVTGLYDQSMIVITADHGISFRPDDERRKLTRTNYQDIIPVPLLIKMPHQHNGKISDRNVQTIDILPTISDLLNMSLPWSVDGRSVFDTSLPERAHKIAFTVFRLTPEHRQVFDPHILSKYETLERKLSLFGDRTKHIGYSIVPYDNLIGKNIDEADLAGEPKAESKINNEYLFYDISLEDPFIPAQIIGCLFQDENIPQSHNLAIAINGTIRAVTQTFRDKEGETKFSAVVPESSFRKGRNEVEIFVIYGDNKEQAKLVRTRQQKAGTYSLSSPATLTSSENSSIEIVPDAIQGSMDRAEVKGKNVIIHGWAADVKESKPADTIVIFVNGNFLFSGNLNAERPDVVDYFGNKELLRSGFHYTFPLLKFKDIENAELRIFAVSKNGVASELDNPEGFKGIMTSHKSAARVAK